MARKDLENCRPYGEGKEAISTLEKKEKKGEEGVVKDEQGDIFFSGKPKVKVKNPLSQKKRWLYIFFR